MNKPDTIKMYGAEYISLRRAKALTGYSSSNIYRLVNEGLVRRVNRGATHVYNLADLERYLYDGTEKPTAEASAKAEAEEFEI